VNRSVLDFDFEKCCSVTLSPLHCYACLVCGKYFQGRGPATMAYTHALEAGHHVFMKLADGRVYCLPDGYEVLDRSLDDIRHVLDPRFGADALAALDTSRAWSSALDGSEYLPGVVGLNNDKATDYVNVVLQALVRVKPLRDAMLRRVSPPPGAPGADSPVLQRFGELLGALVRVLVAVAVYRTFDGPRHDLDVGIGGGRIVDDLRDQQRTVLHQTQHGVSSLTRAARYVGFLGLGAA
jgi:U4/U6.U5 tri-snRNP-associated protein 2